jgi:Family of unknown function (DUF5681)
MPFQPGQSGNAAGRPRGARNKATVLIEQLLEDDAESIIRPIIAQAKSGNTSALVLLARSLLPKRKDAPVRLTCRRSNRPRTAPLPLRPSSPASVRAKSRPARGHRSRGWSRLLCGQSRRRARSAAGLSRGKPRLFLPQIRFNACRRKTRTTPGQAA